jgi:hypothetical protein
MVNSEKYEQVSSRTDVTEVSTALKTLQSLSNTASIWGRKFRSKQVSA